MRCRLPLGAARAPLRMPTLVPLPDGIEREAVAAAHARWVEEDRRGEAEELSDLDAQFRNPSWDAGVE